MSSRLWQHRITDIIEAIEKIQRYVEGMGFDAFEKDSKTIDAVIRNFIIIGEAARRVPEEVVESRPSIPWRLMGDMRNFAVHEYWGVDSERSGRPFTVI
ncbi:MAG: HepT-like ribonuclease domain-containing protein [bacterium]